MRVIVQLGTSVLMVFSLFACGGDDNQGNSPGTLDSETIQRIENTNSKVNRDLDKVQDRRDLTREEISILKAALFYQEITRIKLDFTDLLKTKKIDLQEF
ncbi:MAG: hypothetical protein AB8E15_04785 [Bdellovibrionales bacterium]